MGPSLFFKTCNFTITFNCNWKCHHQFLPGLKISASLAHLCANNFICIIKLYCHSSHGLQIKLVILGYIMYLMCLLLGYDQSNIVLLPLNIQYYSPTKINMTCRVTNWEYWMVIVQPYYNIQLVFYCSVLVYITVY